jgi:hypothetical protein
LVLHAFFLRKSMSLAFYALIMAGCLSAATISSSLSTVGTNGFGDTVYRYTYDLANLTLQINQELNIRFAVDTYQELLNGVAPGGGEFDLLLFQPNSPGGADGAYSLLALVNHPDMNGIFSVDFVLLPGATPTGVQQFFVNQLDGDGNFLNTVSSDLIGIPEPGSLWLGLSGLLAAGLVRAAGRFRR